MSEIRVLIIEDEPVIAENIAHYLNNHDFKVCGIAYDATTAKQLLEYERPDAAIVDINLDSEMNGIEIARLINERYNIPFIFLTSYADKETIEKVKMVKPWGYIVKPFNENTLLATVTIAVSNHALARNNELPELNMEKINRQLLTPVSEREFEVLRLIYSGKTNQQIAEELFVSINTIKKHINNAYLKCNVNTRSSAIVKLRELMNAGGI